MATVKTTTEEAQQSDKDTRAKKGYDNSPDQASGTQTKQAHQEASNKSTYQANNDIADNTVAAATHDKASQRTSDQTYKQPPKNRCYINICELHCILSFHLYTHPKGII
jgi:hypothetical protein